jgi:hypothetical protein
MLLHRMTTPKSKFLSKISTFKFSFINYEFFKSLQLIKCMIQLNMKINFLIHPSIIFGYLLQLYIKIWQKKFNFFCWILTIQIFKKHIVLALPIFNITLLIPRYEQVFPNPWRKHIPCHLTFHLWHTQLSWTQPKLSIINVRHLKKYFIFHF